MKYQDEETEDPCMSNGNKNMLNGLKNVGFALKWLIDVGERAPPPQGQIWEHALEHCRQLAHQYEEELVDYYAMADLRRKEAELYENIMTRLRPEPEYFRVAFYGRSFPAFLQNKALVQ